MKTSVDALQAKVRRLEEELGRLRARPLGAGSTLLAAAGGPRAASLSKGGTVVGVEEMIATVDCAGRIAFANGEMARFWMLDRKDAIGTALASVDQTELGEGFFTGLVEGARGAADPWVVERECPSLDPARLPGKGKKRPQTAPVVRIVATGRGGGVTLVMQDITEIRWLERNFARCVSPEVLVRMYQTPEADYLTPERLEISVLFCDLRGFTSMSSTMPPEEVHLAVNSFLAQMVAAVESFGGTVDKFVGDEVMALFGAPLPQDDHALRALLCAIEMQARHRQWLRDREAEARPGCGLGVGIATGPVVVGHVGTPQRLEYTALGHTVNVGARLCSDAKAGEILVVGRTYESARETLRAQTTSLTEIPRLHFETAGRRRFKNVPESIEVIAVSCAAAPAARSRPSSASPTRR